MNLLKNTAALLALMTIFFSCRKERSFENKTGVVIDQNWSFAESGNAFAGPMDSANIRTIGVANSLNLSGPSADGKGQITLQVLSNGSIVKGAYNNPQILFQYSLNGSVIFQNTSVDNFTINITSIDSISVTGTFSGVVIDSMGTLQNITDGKFSAALSNTPPALTGRGNLTLWAKQLCSDNSSIYIKVGDSIKFITIAYPSDPACGADGTASFNLPAGPYTVVAACGADTLRIDAGVLPDVCTTLEIDFSQLANKDYFPLQSRWTYGNIDSFDGDTLAINSLGDTAITTPSGTDNFTKFYNVLNDDSSGFITITGRSIPPFRRSTPSSA